MIYLIPAAMSPLLVFLFRRSVIVAPSTPLPRACGAGGRGGPLMKAGMIIKDALILLAGSTLLVCAINAVFSPMEKSTAGDDDPIVTAVVQGDAKAVARLLQNGARCEPGRYVRPHVAHARWLRQLFRGEAHRRNRCEAGADGRVAAAKGRAD